MKSHVSSHPAYSEKPVKNTSKHDIGNIDRLENAVDKVGAEGSASTEDRLRPLSVTEIDATRKPTKHTCIAHLLPKLLSLLLKLAGLLALRR